MAAGPVGVKHPAKKFYLLTALFSALAFILSMIAIFVPWSYKDTAVFERRSIGLWKNCIEYTNTNRDEYLCRENDVDQVGDISGGDEKCRGFIVATQVFAIAAVCFTFLTLIFALLTMGKLWAKPVALALYVALLALLAFASCLIAFLMWIVYAETECQTGSSKWPLSSYSWGWICEVVATFFALLALLTAYLGLYKVLSFKPFIPHEEPPMYPEAEAPMYSNQAPYYPGQGSMYPQQAAPFGAMY